MIKLEQVPGAVKTVLKSLIRRGETDPAMLAVAVIRAWPGAFEHTFRGPLDGHGFVLPLTETHNADEIVRLRAEVERLNTRVDPAAVQAWIEGLGDVLGELKDTEIAQLRAEVERKDAALRPLACTCEAKHQDECSRSEVDCPFWNARAALTTQEKQDD